MKAKAAKLTVEIPVPTLLGYFAKPTWKRPDWLKAPQVEEICSVSECMSRGDWDWINEWRHNGMWVFDSPDLAWSVVPESLRAQCGLYAYRMFPFRYFLGQKVSSAIPEVNPMPLDGSFINLGYDLVSRECHTLVSPTCGGQFDHSPLSCNHLAESVPTNRYCLLDTVEEAFALAPTLEVPGQPPRGEPGPYHIVEVWRQRRA